MQREVDTKISLERVAESALLCEQNSSITPKNISQL